MRFKILLVATVCCCTACVPAVSHGPRVEAGFAGGFTAAVPVGPRYQTGDEGRQPLLFGPVGVDLGYGFVASGHPPFRLGIHVPVPLAPFAQADLYVQAPDSVLQDWIAGVGVNGSRLAVMPYLQFGPKRQSAWNWHSTQGIALLRNSGGLYGVLWMPGVVVRHQGESVVTSGFATAGLGRKFQYGHANRGLLSIGVAMEFRKQQPERCMRRINCKQSGPGAVPPQDPPPITPSTSPSERS